MRCRQASIVNSADILKNDYVYDAFGNTTEITMTVGSAGLKTSAKVGGHSAL